MKSISGRAFVFGDDINTDVMAPGLYFKAPMAEMARHCLEAVNPDFPRQVQPGDLIVAGRNFGIGSAREQAAMALTHLGVGAAEVREVASNRRVLPCSPYLSAGSSTAMHSTLACRRWFFRKPA